MSEILMIGDIHGEWGILNSIINIKKPKMIIQCGDFGFYPNEDQFNPLNRIKNKIGDSICNIHWCDGNHEDYNYISMMVDENYPEDNIIMQNIKNLGKCTVAPGVFYQPRGSTITLPDGRNILFMGGAYSIDKKFRTPGYDWFPEEIITEKDLENLPDKKIDIVVSHTCPMEFEFKFNKYYYGMEKIKDPSRFALSFILEKYNPQYWYFGHWHMYKKGKVGKTNWTMLNMTNQTGFWEWLPD